jgi:hypothetical protein
MPSSATAAGGGYDELASVADRLLSGLAPRFSADFTRIDLPGVERRVRDASPLEAFARSFLLAAARVRGEPSEKNLSVLARYRSGLVNATAAGRARWPEPALTRQVVVEAAWIAIGLELSKPWLWDTLSGAERDSIADWLLLVDEVDVPVNNWLLFPVVIHQFLLGTVGRGNREVIDRNLDLIDSMHAADGWYGDGFGHAFDHYSGWGFNFLTSIWLWMLGDQRDSQRAATYRERAGAFLSQYQLLFDAEGCPMPLGRSLTYRFAALAPFWAAELAGVSAIAPGRLKALSTRSVQYFVDRAAIDGEGVLTKGWTRPFAAATQSYSSPGSPYMASAGLLGLALGPNHPVWSSTGEPLAIEEGDYTVALGAPGLIVQGTRRDGIVRLYNHGSDRYPEHEAHDFYEGICHSTRAPADVSGAGTAAEFSGPAGRTSIRIGQGDWRGRSHLHPVDSGAGSASSRWYPHEAPAQLRQWARHPDGGFVIAGGLRLRRYGRRRIKLERPRVSWDDPVDILSVVRCGIELRVVRAAVTATSKFRAEGFVIASDRELAVTSQDAHASASDGEFTSEIWALSGDGEAVACQFEGANAAGRWSATPAVEFSFKPGANLIVVATRLCGDQFAADRLPVSVLRSESGLVEVEWADGARSSIEWDGRHLIEPVV